MGCGCGAKSNGGSASVPSNRSTVYEVLDPTQTVIATFSNLQEARTKAIEITGRVRVTSQSV